MKRKLGKFIFGICMATVFTLTIGTAAAYAGTCNTFSCKIKTATAQYFQGTGSFIKLFKNKYYPTISGGTSSGSASSGNTTQNGTSQLPQAASSYAEAMLHLVNEERTAIGLAPLSWNKELAEVAQAKAQDMADNNYFSHTSPTYGSPFEMMRSFGISYRYAAENIAKNSSVEKAHTALMNSDGHRKNILNANYTEIGIGIVKTSSNSYTVVQMFIG